MPRVNLPGREGQFVPGVTFRLRRDGEWATLTTDDLFAGRNVVVFSLPGAFTPTCSSTRLPVADADTMRTYINPGACKPDQVAILTREGCAFCAKAKQQLADAGYPYVEVPLAHSIRTKSLGAIAGAGTVPQVFINGRLIGGADDPAALRAKAS